MSASKQQPEWLTVDEVAAYTRAPRASVYSWVQSRKIESVKLGKRVLVPRSEVERLIEQGRRPALGR